ncbi:hypothetical protein B296_00005613 [Ensete ventricosum]|uniref:TNase-like domain-containing protein n=1 Tax=Ensete ventricosum TaxID=4639 RepID=A0A427A6L0_ENSVE|nr:hypothetical protein B296_00005613 [Ensete ventricosum]
MGNSLFRFLCGKFSESTPNDEPQSFGPHGDTGVSALARDIFHFEITSQVLDSYPSHPSSTSCSHMCGLLAYYGLPLRNTLPEIPAAQPSKPEGAKDELQTLPVDAKAVADGDTITVYVDTADPRESAKVPRGVHEAAIERARARAVKDYKKADALQKVITDAGYRVIAGPNNEEILARKYRIRLRGIDAPESSMPFGKEAKEELVKLVQGKRLKVYVFGDDLYGRCIAEPTISTQSLTLDLFILQEQMLKRGLAWHYVGYDQRPELARWENDARAARVGLWASSHPEKPWEWRKARRNGA